FSLLLYILLLLYVLIFFHHYLDILYLHSFPTRRSSDLFFNMSELLFSKLNLFNHIYNGTTSIKPRNLALIYRVNSMQSIILINSLWHFLFHILWYIFFINHFIRLYLIVSYL